MTINDKRNSIRKHLTKKPSRRTLNQITDIAVHHSLTTSGSAEAFANYHVGTNGWSVMGYTYVVNRDGSIDWCSDYEVVTPHVGNHNRKSLGICLVGDFRTQKPTDEQYQSLLWLINHVQSKLPNKCKIYGHSEYSGYEWKQCPVIDMNKVRKDAVNYNGDYNTPTPSQPSSTTLLKLNDRGAQVKQLQEDLIKLGYSLPKYGADSHFGQETLVVIKKFQTDNGLTVDGVYGKNTAKVLVELLASTHVHENVNKTKQYDKVNVVYNGKSIEALLIDDKTHIWVREIATLVGVPVGYKDGIVYLNGIELDENDVTIIEGKAYVHVRLVGKICGLTVEWNGNTNTVILSK